MLFQLFKDIQVGEEFILVVNIKYQNSIADAGNYVFDLIDV